MTKYVYRPIFDDFSLEIYVQTLEVLEEGKVGDKTFYLTDDGDYGQNYLRDEQVFTDSEEAKQALVEVLENVIEEAKQKISRYLEAIEELND